MVSYLQSCWSGPSSALKYRVPPTAVRTDWLFHLFDPIMISVRVVPSYFHSSRPVPSSEEKYRLAPTAVKLWGPSNEVAPPGPTLISERLVPSYFHSW